MADRKLKGVSPHVEVYVWRLKQIRRQVSDPVLCNKLDRLSGNMLDGQTLWVSGTLMEKFEAAANAPKEQSENQGSNEDIQG